MRVRIAAPIGASKITLSSKGVRTAVLTALNSQAKVVRDMLESTTATWENAKPKWRYEKKSFGYGIYGVGVTAIPDFGAQKWEWLDGGTSIRWAMMRRGFQPKTGAIKTKISHHGTATNLLASRSGANTKPAFVGEMAFIRRGLPAQPGIEPRNWTKTIIEMRSGQDGPFVASIQNAIRNALGTKVVDWSGPAKDIAGGPSYDYEGNVVKRSREKATSFSYHGSPLMDLIMDLDE
jgi:hypothetical protein